MEHEDLTVLINQGLDGNPGLVVMGGDSCLRGCEFESHTGYYVDIFSHYVVAKIVMFDLNR